MADLDARRSHATAWLDNPFDEMIVVKYSWNGATFQYRWTQGIPSGGAGQTQGKGVTWLSAPKGVYSCGIYLGTKAVVERVTP